MKVKVKKITELDWESHPGGMGGERAVIFFKNGYGASCIRGGVFYTKCGTYEIAVLNTNGSIAYDTPITNDVLGYLPEHEANKALRDIANLPKLKAKSRHV